jgi:hypothetical protein
VVQCGAVGVQTSYPFHQVTYILLADHSITGNQNVIKAVMCLGFVWLKHEVWHLVVPAKLDFTFAWLFQR